MRKVPWNGRNLLDMTLRCIKIARVVVVAEIGSSGRSFSSASSKTGEINSMAMRILIALACVLVLGATLYYQPASFPFVAIGCIVAALFAASEWPRHDNV